MQILDAGDLRIVAQRAEDVDVAADLVVAEDLHARGRHGPTIWPSSVAQP